MPTTNPPQLRFTASGYPITADVKPGPVPFQQPIWRLLDPAGREILRDVTFGHAWLAATTDLATRGVKHHAPRSAPAF